MRHCGSSCGEGLAHRRVASGEAYDKGKNDGLAMDRAPSVVSLPQGVASVATPCPQGK